MKRGFKVVVDEHKKYGEGVRAHGINQVIYPPILLPTRADKRSAGYDFYTPVDFAVLPHSKMTIWTNVKAYMQEDEVLQLFVRSSIGIKHDCVLANGTGIIDASYYENPDNDGNIGIVFVNRTGQTKEFKAGSRIVQGIFTKYLIADEDETLNDERIGGIGSSGS